MKKNLARLAQEQSSCNLRIDLESDMRAYVCMSSIREWTHTSHTLKAIHMYVHHDRKPVCIAKGKETHGASNG
jgi:hypothetical protein